jgi:hypothetical protein
MNPLLGGAPDALGLSPRGRGLGVHAQRQAASAGLGGVALARHVALAVGQAGAAGKLVVAEALSAILGAGQAVPLSAAVCCAFGVGDFVVADVREGDAREGAGVEVVGVASFVGPASWGRG